MSLHNWGIIMDILLYAWKKKHMWKKYWWICLVCLCHHVKEVLATWPCFTANCRQIPNAKFKQQTVTKKKFCNHMPRIQSLKKKEVKFYTASIILVTSLNDKREVCFLATYVHNEECWLSNEKRYFTWTCSKLYHQHQSCWQNWFNNY